MLPMNADAMAVELALALGAASMLSVGPNNLALFREGLRTGSTTPSSGSSSTGESSRSPPGRRGSERFRAWSAITSTSSA